MNSTSTNSSDFCEISKGDGQTLTSSCYIESEENKDTGIFFIPILIPSIVINE